MSGPYFDESTRVTIRTALKAIFAEWGRTDADFATRVCHLQAGAGLNDPFLLNASTVSDDAGAIDQLFGQGEADWFLVGTEDITDSEAGEIVASIP